ncbi:CPBP family intramembrane glutamic endopeptidase [Collimonas silvisoli]|uniref:CPBP family intramembrane glutamic endopeptidase n=1 Tax=Collimonas silvisoli TaxID=2825884 RepID=UPI001B8AA993|nr:type II CAAX endopeptidase family protein [Collimonas silvisoli]
MTKLITAASAWILPSIGLFFGLIVFSYGLPMLPIHGTLLWELVFWGMGAAMIAYVLVVEKRPLSSIGIHSPKWSTLWLGMGGAVLMTVGTLVIFAVVFPLLGLNTNEKVAGKIVSDPLWVQTLIFARAGIVEEIIFRGYAIERVKEITGSYPWAALISVVAFTMAHLASWGWAHLIPVAFGGVFLALLYLWKKDLICNMIVHFLTDFISFAIYAANQQ